MKSYRAIGLMSGTSLDGADAALIETDGERVLARGPSGYRAYSESERGVLRAALAQAAQANNRDDRSGVLAESEKLVTEIHAQLVEDFIARAGIERANIDVVGFHGQTVLHRPAQKLTIQIGDGAALARRLRVPVVYDLRAADVAAGGQGAPLVPVYHRALASSLADQKPLLVVNIGGVSNVTYIDGDSEPLACDTGPGNALIDDFMRERAGVSRDAAGVNAAQGEVDEQAVARVLRHPFFAKAPPKSLDRNDFRQWVASEARVAEKTLADGAATLTAITAASIAAIRDHLPRLPSSLIVSGGGGNNITLMRMLAARVAPIPVRAADSVGWDADAMEAQAFAFLAVRSLLGLPLTFPNTTGVRAPLTGGVLAKP